MGIFTMLRNQRTILLLLIIVSIIGSTFTINSLVAKGFINSGYISLINYLLNPQCESDEEKVIVNFNKALDIQDEEAGHIYMGYGILYAKKGMIQKSIDNFDNALILMPEYQPGLFYIGMLHKEIGNEELYLDYWKRGKIEIKFTSQGKKQEENGYLEASCNSYYMALKINPNWEPAISGLSKVLHKLSLKYRGNGYLEKGFSFLKESIKVLPIPNDFVLLGDYYRNKNDYAIASSWYQEGLQSFPDDPILIHRSGIIDYNNGDLNFAESKFRKVISIDPSYGPAHHWLGIVLFADGALSNAEKEILEGIRLNPEYAWGFVKLGDIYVEQGKFLEAIKLYKKALKISPDIEYATKKILELCK